MEMLHVSVKVAKGFQ